MSNVNNNNKTAVHKMLYIIIMILHMDYREGVNNRPHCRSVTAAIELQTKIIKNRLLYGGVFFPRE